MTPPRPPSDGQSQAAGGAPDRRRRGPLSRAGRATWGAYATLVARISAHPRRAALVLFAITLPALVLTAQFFAHVRAELQELLPRSAPSVRALEQIHDRIGGKSHLTVIAQSDDPTANRRFISELTARVEKRKLKEARSVQGSVAGERDWIKDHAPLLLPQDKFDSVMDDLEEAVHEAKAKAMPFYVDLDGDDAKGKGGEEEGWTKLQQRLDEETRAHDRFPNGYLETHDGKTVVLLIWLEGSEVDMGPAERLLGAVEEEVNAMRPGYPAQLRVAYNGEVPNLIEEHDAILADLSISSVIVFLLVGGLIAFYFRSLRAVAAVLASLGPGLLFTFAIGRLTVGSLNSNTAFLGSIIAGNGINYPLLLLAFYRARSPGEPRPRAIVDAARQALPGTLAAAATASAAYGGLAASSFKGFSQFGWLGGVGMLTTWLFTFVTMPIAIALIDPPRHGERPTAAQGHLLSFFARRKLSLAVAGMFIAVSLVVGGLGARRAAKQGLYEMDLLTLRNRESITTGSGSWDPKMNELFGVWLNPVVALVKDASERESLARALRDRLTVPRPDGSPAPAERVETISAYTPPVAEQEQRLGRLRKLAKTIAQIPDEKIPEKARPLIATWLSEDHLKPIQPSEVPHTLAQAYTEVSGDSSKVVLIYPSLKINYNDASNILRFADALAEVPLPQGAVVGGGFLFMAEIIRLVHDEAPQVVGTVCLLVALVLIPFFLSRPWRILIIVAAIAVVAIAAQSVMVALGVRVNMLNFAAVPITIGVGADYVVNLFGAMDAFEVDARRACARMGGAILLCSLTTVVGYVSLLIAQSGALRTFGWAAVLGEVMAVVTVLLVLPVFYREKKPARTEENHDELFAA